VDAAIGVTEEDAGVARLLRRSRQPVLVVANKVDTDTREPDAWTFERLGLGDPQMVSALHGRGTGDMLDAMVGLLPPVPDLGGEAGATLGNELEGQPDDVVAVAIVGRPNVGKSTLFNRLIGDHRSIVHDLPGTTRDTVDTVIETNEGRIRFVDTAGLRRRGKQADGAEYYSLVRALRAIDHADASLFVIDATEGVTHQDQRLAERVDAAGNPMVVCLNKWDVLSTEERARVVTDVEDRLAFLSYAPVLKISAKTGLGVHKLLPTLAHSIDAYHRRVPTGDLNKLIAEAQATHPSPGGRVLYATQGAVDPPTFTLFANRTVPPTYLRYLERRIREHFQFGPTPLKLRVRRRSS
jgi:GTP-binding protein